MVSILDGITSHAPSAHNLALYLPKSLLAKPRKGAGVENSSHTLLWCKQQILRSFRRKHASWKEPVGILSKRSRLKLDGPPSCPVGRRAKHPQVDQSGTATHTI